MTTNWHSFINHVLRTTKDGVDAAVTVCTKNMDGTFAARFAKRELEELSTTLDAMMVRSVLVDCWTDSLSSHVTPTLQGGTGGCAPQAVGAAVTPEKPLTQTEKCDGKTIHPSPPDDWQKDFDTSMAADLEEPPPDSYDGCWW